MTRKVTGLILLVLTLSALPSRVEADWLFTPFVGGNFGGGSIDTQTNFGISAAWMGAGTVGFEFDFGVAPDFLDMGLDDDFTLIDESSVSTFMGNVILGVPVGGPPGMGVRPYAAFGAGAVRTSASSRFALIDSSDTEFGWNVGRCDGVHVRHDRPARRPPLLP